MDIQDASIQPDECCISFIYRSTNLRRWFSGNFHVTTLLQRGIDNLDSSVLGSSMRNRARGQSTIELVAGIIVIIPIVLFGLDAATLFMAQSLNSQVCRDAARAASNGPPSAIFPNSPKQRAELVVRRTNKTEGAIRLNPEVTVTENLRQPLPTQPFGGVVDGEVTVETSVDVAPPFIIKNVVPKGLVTIKASQTFPFTWVMENAATAAKRDQELGGKETGPGPEGVPGGPGEAKLPPIGP